MKSFLVVILTCFSAFVFVAVTISPRALADEPRVIQLNPNQGPSTGEDQRSTTGEITTVSSGQDFLDAIGPDRTIEIDPGTYILSDLPSTSHNAYLRWDEAYDGMNIVIRNTKNLTIRAKRPGSVKLFVSPQYANVLNFDRCENITLENLVMGHYPDKGSCAGGVIFFQASRGLTVNGCDLFGCGTEGLTVQESQDITMNRTIIRDCTTGILSAYKGTNIILNECQFFDNKEFWGVSLSECNGVTFKNCSFRGNTAETFFEIYNSSGITVSGGVFADNNFTTLMSQDARVDFLEVQGM